MRPRTLWSLFLACALPIAAGCKTPVPTVPAPEKEQPKEDVPEIDPDGPNAPTPYTANQIRSATHVGRTLTFVIESPDKPPVKQRFRFVDVDDERATIATEILDEKGNVLGQPEMKISTWEELRKHASYPKTATTISSAVVETDAGSFPCKRYTVVEIKDGSETRTVACFANELPGPPVEMTKEKDGKLVMSMTLLKYEAGTP
jgi:hypothetical protein